MLPVTVLSIDASIHFNPIIFPALSYYFSLAGISILLNPQKILFFPPPHVSHTYVFQLAPVLSVLTLAERGIQ